MRTPQNDPLKPKIKTLHLVSLGCARNLVDSEFMLGQLLNSGWVFAQDPDEAEVIIINTCSFIESAIEESIDTILELASYKQHGACKRLIVAGCLPERFREEIVDSLPEVDIFLGTGAYDAIGSVVEGALDVSGCFCPDPNFKLPQTSDAPRVRTSLHSAYLRIAEGCSRHCTYCIIPKLRGLQRSRPLTDIVPEAKLMIDSNIRELILISQDTTNYGRDLVPPMDLSRLLEKMSDLSEKVWIRFLYGHPNSIDEKIIRTVAAHPNICSYFDIPIQHASEPVLKKMGRKYSQDDLQRLFEKIKSTALNAALRTTVIVGFPGETDRDFETLLSFVEDLRFDHLGVFTYSDADDLPSHGLADHVPSRIAKQRLHTIMSSQAKISAENNQNRIGSVYKTLVESGPKDKLFTGRTYFQAPEVDGITYITSEKLQTGTFVEVKVTEATEYDLIGEIP
ncbi:30S ribosomal protein S12 methylthiotransferase RimO [Thermodesulfobacteriota bacterium]